MVVVAVVVGVDVVVVDVVEVVELVEGNVVVIGHDFFGRPQAWTPRPDVSFGIRAAATPVPKPPPNSAASTMTAAATVVARSERPIPNVWTRHRKRSIASVSVRHRGSDSPARGIRRLLDGVRRRATGARRTRTAGKTTVVCPLSCHASCRAPTLRRRSVGRAAHAVPDEERLRGLDAPRHCFKPVPDALAHVARDSEHETTDDRGRLQQLRRLPADCADDAPRHGPRQRLRDIRAFGRERSRRPQERREPGLRDPFREAAPPEVPPCSAVARHIVVDNRIRVIQEVVARPRLVRANAQVGLLASHPVAARTTELCPEPTDWAEDVAMNAKTRAEEVPNGCDLFRDAAVRTANHPQELVG